MQVYRLRPLPKGFSTQDQRAARAVILSLIEQVERMSNATPEEALERYQAIADCARLYLSAEDEKDTLLHT